MTSNTQEAKHTLEKVLADQTTAERLLALQALHAAFAWCAATMEEGSVAKRTEAMRAVFLLEEALGQGQAYLKALPALIERANPAPSVRQELETEQAAVDQAQRQIGELRIAIAPLEKLAQQHESLEAEKKTLEQRLVDLKRWEGLSQAVEALRTQVQRVERHLSPEGSEAQRLETILHDRAQSLVTLSKELLTQLQDKTATWLKTAAKEEQRVARAHDELEAAQQRYNRASEALRELNEVLSHYLEADRAIASALGDGVQGAGVDETLRQAQHLLEQADRALRKGIEANRLVSERLKPRSFGGGAR